VNPTEGEDAVEASLSLLIDLMGSSLMDQYVEDIMNPNLPLQQHIVVRKVNRPNHPSLQPGQPAIFYGRGRATHFTCTTDGIQLWDSYKNGIQQRNTDHFCQTFALLYMQHSFFHGRHRGDWFHQLITGEYMHNAWVAKEFACHVVRTMDRLFDISSIVEQAIEEGGHDMKRGFTVNHLLRSCESISLQDMEASTFYNKVYL